MVMDYSTGKLFYSGEFEDGIVKEGKIYKDFYTGEIIKKKSQDWLSVTLFSRFELLLSV
jgi:hypothetical protein